MLELLPIVELIGTDYNNQKIDKDLIKSEVLFVIRDKRTPYETDVTSNLEISSNTKEEN